MRVKLSNSIASSRLLTIFRRIRTAIMTRKSRTKVPAADIIIISRLVKTDPILIGTYVDVGSVVVIVTLVEISEVDVAVWVVTGWIVTGWVEEVSWVAVVVLMVIDSSVKKFIFLFF